MWGLATVGERFWEGMAFSLLLSAWSSQNINRPLFLFAARLCRPSGAGYAFNVCWPTACAVDWFLTPLFSLVCLTERLIARCTVGLLQPHPPSRPRGHGVQPMTAPAL